MNFIKKVFSATSTTSSKKNDINENAINGSNQIGSFKNNDSKLLNDFENANYYNFFRMLDRKSTYSSGTGLVASKSSTQGFELEQFDIEAYMSDTCVVSLFTQKYNNNFEAPVEAQYKIALPPNSAVSDFVVILKDKVLKGKIKEKSKAQEKYNDSIATGGKAFLAEKTNDGLFSLLIGNLQPKEEVTVKITITSEIATHMESYHYLLHSSMFPKDSRKFNLNYTLHANLSTPIESVELLRLKDASVNFENEEKTKLTLKYSTSNGINEFYKRMLLAVLVPKFSEKPESFIEYCPIEKNHAIGLNFYPNFNIPSDEVDQKAEYIFVIDCSGSMSGTPIKNAKRALEICMKSLNEKSKFNIYRFGSSFEKFNSVSQLYNDESLETAMSYLQSTDANLGGTELMPPIRDILEKEYDPEYPRQIFILTDGEISERDQLIEYAAKESNTTRIFTFGIGNGVDKELVVGLSQACKGYYELIEDNKDMEEKVMKLLSISFLPTLSNIKVDWGELSVDQAPSVVRPLFTNERMMLYGTLNKPLPENTTNVQIKLYGNGPSGDVLVFPINLDFSKAVKDSRNIHTLSAFKQIQDLEESEKKEKKDHKDKIVELGKRYGLVSKHTSYLVTAESEGEVTENSMISVEVITNQPVSPQIDSYFSAPARACAVFSQPFTLSRRVSVDISESDGDEDDYEEEQGWESNEDCLKEMNECLSEMVVEQSMVLDKCEKLCDVSVSPKKKSVFSNFSFGGSKSNGPMPVQSSACAPPPPAPVYSSPIKPSISYECEKKEKAAPSKQIKSGDIVLDLIRIQKANGSFTKSQVSSLFSVASTPKELSSNEDIWVTLVAIAKFMSYPSQKSQWDLIVQKASKFCKQQLSKLNLSFDDLLNNAKSSI